MRRARYGAGVLLLAAGLSFGAIATPAGAESAGGGDWDHGVSASTTWSFYNHPTKQHRSSVRTSAAYQTSTWKSTNVWAFAQLTSTVSGNKAYYDYR